MTDRQDEAAKEIARAVQAIAPAVNVTAETVNAGLRWFGTTFGRPVAVAVGMLEDWVYVRRVWARIQTIRKARELLGDQTIPEGALPDGFLVPLLEACGDAQTDDLQDLWAELLARATMDPDAQNPAFIQVLRTISSQGAVAFRDLLAEAKPPGHIELGITYGAHVGLSVEWSLLRSLGLFDLHRGPAMQMARPAGGGRPVMGSTNRIVITSFGLAFAQAVGILTTDGATPSRGSDFTVTMPLDDGPQGGDSGE